MVRTRKAADVVAKIIVHEQSGLVATPDVHAAHVRQHPLAKRVYLVEAQRRIANHLTVETPASAQNP